MAKRSKPLKAPDKLVFLLSFVPYLLEQRVVDVAEAAQHFGMTEEEIRDAVRLIATSGLPGSTGTYQPNDLFDIDWDSFEDDDVIVIVHHVAIDDAPRLSAREAAALMAGLQYLSASPESAGSASLASLRAKLAAGASSAPSRLAVAETEADASLGLIREAVAEGRQLEFDYLNARGERGRRRADPLRIISQDADWYLQAYCHTREDVRNFRVDRMSDLAAHRRADRRPLAPHRPRHPVPGLGLRPRRGRRRVTGGPSAAVRLPRRLALPRGRRATPGHAPPRARARPEAARRGPARPRHRGLAPRGACGGGGLGERRAGGLRGARNAESDARPPAPDDGSA